MTIRIQPGDVEFDVLREETIMAAALRHGYRWPTVCGGQARCTVCYLRVLGDPSSLGPMTAKERHALEPLLRRHPQDPSGAIRLACQATLMRETVVFKRGLIPLKGGAECSDQACGS